MYIRRKVFSLFQDEYGEERYFSTTEFEDERLYSKKKNRNNTKAKKNARARAKAGSNFNLIDAARKSAGLEPLPSQEGEGLDLINRSRKSIGLKPISHMEPGKTIGSYSSEDPVVDLINKSRKSAGLDPISHINSERPVENREASRQQQKQPHRSTTGNRGANTQELANNPLVQASRRQAGLEPIQTYSTEELLDKARESAGLNKKVDVAKAQEELANNPLVQASRRQAGLEPSKIVEVVEEKQSPRSAPMGFNPNPSSSNSVGSSASNVIKKKEGRLKSLAKNIYGKGATHRGRNIALTAAIPTVAAGTPIVVKKIKSRKKD